MSETISDNWKPFKNDEKRFFIWCYKLFSFWDIYIFVLTFDYVEKRLDKKVKVNSKIYDVTDWTAYDYNTHIARYLKK